MTVSPEEALANDPYERMVLSHLEEVQRLPIDVQANIARPVDTCIKLAKAAKDEALLARLAMGAMEEQAKAIGQGANSTMEPRWAAPALAEAWCYAMMSLSNGNLNRESAGRQKGPGLASTGPRLRGSATAVPSGSRFIPRVEGVVAVAQTAHLRRKLEAASALT